MNESSLPAYGLWPIVIISSAVMIIFAFSFSHPQTKRDWRSFGAFSAFLVALYTEMYGFPLTIYFLSGWLIKRYPGLDLFTHASGHLWNTILGLKGDSHFNELHIISELLIGAGFILLAAAWKVLYRAQSSQQIAISGPYAYIRHPQYVGFILIMVGLLLQWPTIPTLIMFPILVTMYIRLARREEREAIAMFGEIYVHYAKKTPAFFLHLNLSPAEQGPPSPDR
ncbi:MAG: isoprenylcysteine carboxyl methyltransferase [Chloroflexi bacterium GWB2_49_20]|nr:MAG: isoprenylcysteine carboxyl methyltransferase [Chloroflexi bacterium GWB2_49_20]OGN77744.1 MAG: isoprenylcysteine carboxyl methyltransferase [Chloroflexi bacterium GWC2_49_37]OGN86519.1 MAG: isoprenylcysteine carboxyl methyltransferase [Chloroflexi bacterium GWD2_49_16]HBG74771.1 isoprenylcysteine carboxyl methyltransferase [Anaerolineae bacterium]